MLSSETAHEFAVVGTREKFLDSFTVDQTAVRELSSGWFFPLRPTDPWTLGGSQGVIVNKQTARLFWLGTAYPVERDLELYERGYRFDSYDLVVTAVRDLDGTLDTLVKVGISVVEPVYEAHRVWRIPRNLTRDELREKLKHLPCIFGELPLYFAAEVLEEARAGRVFEFELLDRGKR